MLKFFMKISLNIQLIFIKYQCTCVRIYKLLIRHLNLKSLNNIKKYICEQCQLKQKGSLFIYILTEIVINKQYLIPL